jgi:hypothetical protein
MPNWKYEIDIRNDCKYERNGEIKPHQLANIVAEKLRPISEKRPDDFDLDRIIDNLEKLGKKESAAFEGLDAVLETLYNWARIACCRIRIF